MYLFVDIKQNVCLTVTSNVHVQVQLSCNGVHYFKYEGWGSHLNSRNSQKWVQVNPDYGPVTYIAISRPLNFQPGEPGFDSLLVALNLGLVVYYLNLFSGTDDYLAVDCSGY